LIHEHSQLHRNCHAVADRLPEIERLFARKRLVSFGIPGVILAYLLYVFFAFDVPGLVQRANMDNARILIADSYSYKTHVTQDTRSGQIRVAIEGETKGVYPDELLPDWVAIAGRSAVSISAADSRHASTMARCSSPFPATESSRRVRPATG
jgi:phosphonate transport system permease protein